tara:strand:- start:382 stop:627 length:246 start_codon:yes stop_codon:yes gene_type:complete
MASAVDSTLPADNVKASKADFRAQFLIIKNEISALQKRTGVAGAKAFYGFVDQTDLAEAVRKHHTKHSTLPADLAYGRATL